MSNFQCQHINCDGSRCLSSAYIRLFYSEVHPFDKKDLCAGHYVEDNLHGVKYEEILEAA